jgi:hypothetical protein
MTRRMMFCDFAIGILVVLGNSTVQSPAQPGGATESKPASSPAPADWLTKAEKTDFLETPRYDETAAYCRRLAEASPWISCQSFGKSPEGRDLLLVIASNDQAFTPEAARATGKPIVLVQNCIHAGECAGKDASLMLLRDMAVTKTRQELLDHVILLVMPIFNVDGHERFSPYSRINQNGPEEMGWRTTSRNLNLNRDYIKADAVEMRAWLALWNAWRPDLFIDHHETDGIDWQYDFLYAIDQHPAAAPQVVDWTKAHLGSRLFDQIERDGHLAGPYMDLVDGMNPAKGVRSGWFSPRLSNGYAVVRNRPAILVEGHMLKPYRTQVASHYCLMQRVLEELNREPNSLREAVTAADEATSKMGAAYDPAFKLPIAVGPTDESEPFTLRAFAFRRELSDISGGLRIIYDNSKPVDITTTWFNGTKVTKSVTPPLAYIIPPQWTEVIDVARAHGLSCERLAEPVTAEFESYRFSDVSFSKTPYEGRFSVTYKAEQVIEKRTYIAGSMVIPLRQPSAKVAILLFEPESSDSLVAWGFFNTVFEQKEFAESYVLEKLAREMLAADPKLREEFENRVATDKDFAGSRHDRLDFFYRRSPYYERWKDSYPVGRVVKPLPSR